MYARVMTAIAQQGKLDECNKMIRDSILPGIKKQKGFKGAFFLTNHDTGKGISITLWNTEADSNLSFNSDGARDKMSKLLPLLVGQATMELYEVSLQE